MMKFAKKVAMLLTATLFAFAPAAQTFAAPVEVVELEAKKKPAISQSELELEVGKSAKLKVKGTKKKVKWSSSDKTVAKVNKKGKVTAVADGVATITAKVGKKKYTCEVNVWSQEFGLDASKFDSNKYCVWYYGDLDKEASYYVDGELLTGEIWIDAEDDNSNNIDFNTKPIGAGDHVFEIKKVGYKTYVYNFNIEALPDFGDEVFVDYDGEGEYWVYDQILSVGINPKYENTDLTFKIDDVDAEILNLGTNGDGWFIADFNKPASGTHTLMAYIGGLPAQKLEITIG